MAAEATTEKRLYRTIDDAYVGGVCAGLAQRFEVDTIVVRILAILSTLLTFGAAIIAYLALWAHLPLEPEQGALYDVKPESAESSAFGCVDCTQDISEGRKSGIPVLARLAVAASLMVLFLIIALGVSPLVPGTSWWQFWPLGFLMAGLCLIIIPIRSKHEAVWHAAGIVITAVSASILPMSLGIMSWDTIGRTFGSLWPFVLAAVILCGVGLRLNRGAYVVAAAFCLVAFCAMGLVFCVVPGDLESLFLYSPSGRMFRIDIIRGL